MIKPLIKENLKYTNYDFEKQGIWAIKSFSFVRKFYSRIKMKELIEKINTEFDAFKADAEL